jgi:selenocysteine lyase/cysteine desulfurase
MDDQDPMLASGDLRAEVLAEFARPEGSTYLDSATMGLPPARTVTAMADALQAWQRGQADWVAWDREAQLCRLRLASLVGAAEDEIALLPAVSVASALVASGIPPGSEVLVADAEFASVHHPFAVAEQLGLLALRKSPASSIAEAVTAKTRLIAVSHVHSKNGSLIDLPALRQAASAAGAEIFLDATQSVGVLPMDTRSLGVGYLACAAYKWLCAPSGVAFLYVRKDLCDRLAPLAASWHATEDPYSGFFGGPMTLARSAARFDVSPAWLAWVGARQSLDLLATMSPSARFTLAHGLAREAAASLQLPPPESTIVAVPVEDGGRAATALSSAGVKAAVFDGHVRLAPHFYNTSEDIDRAIQALEPFVR